MPSDFFIRIYILPYHQLFGVCFCCLVLFWELRRRFERRLWWRWMIGAVLMLWAAVVIQSTVLGRSNGTGSQWALIPLHSYREVLSGGNPEILRANLMNVVLFIPAGLLTAALLPGDWPPARRLLIITVLGSVFSLGIECTQYARSLGCPEIDDVIHNTIGAVAGFCALSNNRNK